MGSRLLSEALTTRTVQRRTEPWRTPQARRGPPHEGLQVQLDTGHNVMLPQGVTYVLASSVSGIGKDICVAEPAIEDGYGRRD